MLKTLRIRHSAKVVSSPWKTPAALDGWWTPMRHVAVSVKTIHSPEQSSKAKRSQPDISFRLHTQGAAVSFAQFRTSVLMRA
jgi:hypothetical protein